MIQGIAFCRSKAVGELLISLNDYQFDKGSQPIVLFDLYMDNSKKEDLMDNLTRTTRSVFVDAFEILNKLQRE